MAKANEKQVNTSSDTESEECSKNFCFCFGKAFSKHIFGLVGNSKEHKNLNAHDKEMLNTIFKNSKKNDLEKEHIETGLQWNSFALTNFTNYEKTIKNKSFTKQELFTFFDELKTNFKNHYHDSFFPVLHHFVDSVKLSHGLQKRK